MKKDYSISMAQANVYALVATLPFIVPLFALYVWVWQGLNWDGSSFATLLLLLVFLLSVVVHELIHAFSWRWAAGLSAEEVQLGFQWRTFTPYAHAKVPMPASAYRLGTVMPGLVLGLAPAVVGLLLGQSGLFLFGLLSIFSAGGDLTILWLLRSVKGTQLVEDHPTQAGCFVWDDQP